MAELRRRLSDTGYHLTPTRKPAGRRYEWIGLPRLATDGKYTDYDGLKIFEGDCVLTLVPGVHVFLSANSIHEPTEIGRVIHCYEATHKAKPYAWVRVQWLWRPEILETPQWFVGHPRELFAGTLEDNNAWQAIEV